MSFKQRHLLGYANGNFGKHILFGTIDLALFFYMTDIIGLDPVISGITIFVAMMVDASLDPVIGFVIDKFKWRYGHYIFLGAIFYALSFVLVFALALIDLPYITFYGVALILFRLSYTFIDVPHNALIAKLFGSGHLRTKVSAYRFFFSSVSALLISLAISPILLGGGQSQELWYFFYFALLAAGLSFVSLSIVSYVALKYEPARKSGNSHLVKLPELLTSLASNPQFIIALVVCFFTGLCSPVLAKGIIYFAKYYLLDETMVGYMLPSMMIGQILALPLWVKLSKWYGKKQVLQLSHALLLVTSIFLVMVEPMASTLIVVLSFSAGVAYAAIYMVIWSLLADVVDYHEVKTKVRIDAIMFSLAIMIMKLALGISSAMFGYLLDSVDYQANQSLSHESANLLALEICLIPCIGAVICILVLKRYRISNELQARWQKRLSTENSGDI